MKRYVSLVTVFALAAIASVGAQAPSGWKLHIDRSADATDPDAAGDIKFTTSGSGFHAVNPQAAIYWNPANRAAGNYTVEAKFTLLEPSNHTNYYGLIIGGKDLDTPKQSYVYFMVAQNGTWLLKSRTGQDTPTIARGPVKKPDASGKSTNDLAVRVMADTVDFIVNGATVHSERRTGTFASTDGIYGLRVNHFLNVQIDGLKMTQQ